jgi:ATP-dependent DNA helicase RecQ
MHLDATEAARALGQPRERVVRALDYIESQGWVELKAEGVRHRYRVLKRPEDLNALAEEYFGRGLQRESREIERLGQILELAAATECQVSKLGAHFGEPLPSPCGHCSFCLKGAVDLEQLERPEEPIDHDVWSKAQRLRDEHPDPLKDPRALARLLIGLTSPRLTRAKLTRDPLFGVMDRVPFLDVLAMAEET